TPPTEEDEWNEADDTAFAPLSLIEGTYDVHAWFKDAVGNLRHIIWPLRIDRTPPTIVGMNVTPGATNSRSVSVYLRGQDADDGTIARVCLGEDALDLTCRPATPGSDSYDFELAEGSDGIRTIHAAVEDEAGNRSE